MVLMKRITYIILLINIAFACYQTFSFSSLNPNEKMKINSKQEFEIALASKFHLYKIYIDNTKEALEITMRAAEKDFDEEYILQLAKSAATTRNISLKGLFNNHYIGDKAKMIYDFYQKEKINEAREIFNELDNEIQADIKIARSLEIDVFNYELEIKNHAFNTVMLIMILNGNKTIKNN
jgi:hypothetical protein